VAEEENTYREIIGDKTMGLSSDMDSNFWYIDSNGEWQPFGELTEITFSLNDESSATLAQVLVPLGELEIVPRSEL
jgi:hypothetical protein